MDGYFNYAIPNYYILGEWFLGAIIILYIIYPILLKGMTQNFLLTSIFVTSAFLSVIFYNVFVINPFRNVFVCILPFYFGMILFKYKNLYIDNIFINCISMVGVVILSFCHIPSSYGIIIEEMYGIMLFIVLYSIGNLIMKLDIGGKVKKISDFIGSISFQIFLLQHVVIFKLQSIYNPVDVGDYWKMLTLTIVITIVTAYSLKKVSVLLVHTKQYQKLENYILKINERKD